LRDDHWSLDSIEKKLLGERTLLSGKGGKEGFVASVLLLGKKEFYWHIYPFGFLHDLIIIHSDKLSSIFFVYLGINWSIILRMDKWKGIKELIQEKYPKIEVFAKENGINYNTLSGWISKNRPPRVDEAIKIARGLGTTVEHIFSFDEEPDDIKSLVIHNEKGQMAFIEGDDIAFIPVFPQKVAAGSGQELIDNTEAIALLPFLKRMLRGTAASRARALEVRGDSMTGVHIFDGDMVVFVPGEIRGDGIYVLRIMNELLVKRVEFNPISQKLRIMSENPRYPDRIESADGQAVEVVGKVYGWVHAHPY